MDVSTSPDLGLNHNIDRSPIVKLFSFNRGNMVIEDFDGLRDTEHVYNFCTEKYREKNLPYTNLPDGYVPGDLIILDKDNYDNMITTSNDIWMLMYGAPWCHHCKLSKPDFESAAKELGNDVRFATVDADANRSLAKRFKIDKLPYFKYYDAGYGNKADDMV